MFQLIPNKQKFTHIIFELDKSNNDKILTKYNKLTNFNEFEKHTSIFKTFFDNLVNNKTITEIEKNLVELDTLVNELNLNNIQIKLCELKNDSYLNKLELLSYSRKYTNNNYYYPDLFPVEDTIDNGFDKITESHFNFIFTLRYLF